MSGAIPQRSPGRKRERSGADAPGPQSGAEEMTQKEPRAPELNTGTLPPLTDSGKGFIHRVIIRDSGHNQSL